MNKTLTFIGIYNCLLSFFMIFLTDEVFNFFHTSDSEHILVWKVLGLFVGMFGLGYLLSATNQYVHWPIILMGLSFNISVTFGFIYYLFTAHLSWSISWIVLINCTIWVFPLWRLLNGAFNFNVIDSELIYPRIGAFNKMNESFTNKGECLTHLCENNKVLLIFMRHFGCTFCRKTLDEIRMNRKQLEEKGYRLVLVHSADDQTAETYFNKYGLSDIDYVTDEQSELYREFNIQRGTIGQLFGITSLLAAIRYSFKYGVGRKQGDLFRLPGLVIIKDGKLVHTQHKHRVHENIDWNAILECKTC